MRLQDFIGRSKWEVLIALDAVLSQQNHGQWPSWAVELFGGKITDIKNPVMGGM